MIELASLPAAWMLLGAYLVAVLGGRARAVVALLAPLVAGWAAWQLSDGSALSVTYLGFTLEPLYADATRRLFATIFCLMAFTGVLFSLYQSAGRELAAALAYAGGALGVCFAGDLPVIARCSRQDFWLLPSRGPMSSADARIYGGSALFKIARQYHAGVAYPCRK